VKLFLYRVKLVSLYIIVVFLSWNAIGHASTYKELYKAASVLTKYQISVIRDACYKGISENLCHTLAAIVWKESDAGLYNVNLQDPSASWYHIRIPTAIRYTHLRRTKFNYNRVAQWLLDDPDWAGDIAIDQLKYWMKFHHGSWKKAVESYNAGSRIKNYRYYRDIVRRIKVLIRLRIIN